MSFFPQIMEGPISRFSETADALYGGNSIQFENLVFGYQRIIWGLFKKMVIADRLAPLVAARQKAGRILGERIPLTCF